MNLSAPSVPGNRPLFDRLDLVPLPQSARLAELLEAWRRHRADAPLPRRATLDVTALADCGAGVFLCDVVEEGQDYRLSYDAGALTDLIARMRIGAMLSQCATSPAVVRLRRLFDLVVRRAEPICGAFDLGAGPQAHCYVEVLAMPVGGKGQRVAAILGGVAARNARTGWCDDRARPGSPAS